MAASDTYAEVDALSRELHAAIATLDALEAQLLPEQPPTPSLHAISAARLFAPAFKEANLLTFDAPDLRTAFFSGFEKDNIDEDEDLATPRDAIHDVGERALHNVDVCFMHIKKMTNTRRVPVLAHKAPTREIVAAKTKAVTAMPVVNGFRFT